MRLIRLWKQSEEYGFLKEAHSQALQQKLKDLDRAFDRAQPGKRLPRFKQRGVGDSFLAERSRWVKRRHNVLCYCET